MPAWNTPRTWSAGDIASTGILNAQIRDNFLALAQSIQCGTQAITTVAANTPASQAITFGSTFPTTPVILCTADTSVGTNIVSVTASGASTTGATIWLTTTSATTRTVFWLAIVNLD